jgi:agmatinase
MDNPPDSFDPGDVGRKGYLFGMPFSFEDAQIVVLPVPFDVTVSYSDGTSRGPSAILNASSQLDLQIFGIKEAWRMGWHMLPAPDDLFKDNGALRSKVRAYLERLEEGEDLLPEDHHTIEQVNSLSERINRWVGEKVETLYSGNKIPVILGGEHSAPFGAIKVLSKKFKNLSVLQIDAHADLRKDYEGFEYSHASIMRNVAEKTSVDGIVQVAIRDWCPEESDFVEASNGRIKTFYDGFLKKEMFTGTSWEMLCRSIVSQLTENVYVSFDIDGLSPSNCPNTGTPVPGGLEFEQAIFLIETLVRNNKKIVGFDLCEVNPGQGASEWDANVGARVLFQTGSWAAVSKGWLTTT